MRRESLLKIPHSNIKKGSPLKNQDIFSILVNSAENAAIAAYDLIGKGDKNMADKVAVEAMRKELSKLPEIAKIVIGEGEMDEAPMLFIGEIVGIDSPTLESQAIESQSLGSQSQPAHPTTPSSGINLNPKPETLDIAVDPLEGTNLCAKNMPNAITTIAIGDPESILHAPDCYMDKLAICYNDLTQKDKLKKLKLSNSFKENLQIIAEIKNKPINKLTLITLNRERHQSFIQEAKDLGIEVTLLEDGDIHGVLSVINTHDIYYGTGGAPEGVLAAAALKSVENSYMLAKLIFEDEAQRNRAIQMGLQDPDMELTINDMVKADAIFVASGVTSGDLVQGVQKVDTKTQFKNNEIFQNIEGSFIVESIIFSTIHGISHQKHQIFK